MRYSELKRLLKANGCYKLGEGGNHEKWYSPVSNSQFPVGRHDSEEVRTGTYNAILQQAGIKKGGKK
ncbi:MAG: type II toxin-antitoxin system HicA family toxin [Christensenellaceae bacterium]|jgi:predicted RNA binding protein YcfA (HicA-like mRNA interferase family)|nr:type II toxin-antitoxin system HicA family toxin [Christensenellaceae bacterium]